MLQVIMPMAGKASRFEGAGYKEYKPFIEVGEKRLFEWALSSLAINELKLFPIIREENYDLDLMSPFQTTVLMKETAGALETASKAFELLDNDSPTIILDSDLAFKSESFTEMILSSSMPGAALLTFKSTDPRYSFVRFDSNGLALEVREKQVISNNAIIGAYFFKNANTLKKYANLVLSRSLEEHGMKEYYVSSVFQRMLEEGFPVKVYSSEEFYSFGTPEELQSSLSQLKL